MRHVLLAVVMVVAACASVSLAREEAILSASAPSDALTSLLDLEAEATTELDAAFSAAADAVSEVEAEAAAEAEEEADFDADADADADEEIDESLEADLDAEAEAEAGARVDAEAEAEADVLSVALLEGGDAVSDDKKQKPGDASFCPAGFTLVKDKRVEPGFDGCGSEVTGKSIHGMLSHLPASVTKCCNTHDIGYDTCGRARLSIDMAFKACLTEAVKKEAAIYHILPSTMYSAVRMGGGDPYQVAQYKHCQCEATALTLKNDPKAKPNFRYKINERVAIPKP